MLSPAAPQTQTPAPCLASCPSMVVFDSAPPRTTFTFKVASHPVMNRKSGVFSLSQVGSSRPTCCAQQCTVDNELIILQTIILLSELLEQQALKRMML